MAKVPCTAKTLALGDWFCFRGSRPYWYVKSVNGSVLSISAFCGRRKKNGVGSFTHRTLSVYSSSKLFKLLNL
jgi:hypothetical protein